MGPQPAEVVDRVRELGCPGAVGDTLGIGVLHGLCTTIFDWALTRLLYRTAVIPAVGVRRRVRALVRRRVAPPVAGLSPGRAYSL